MTQLGPAELAAIDPPYYYLDFETVATVLPLYDGHSCHQQVLTQFSVHHRESLGGELQHSEYIADPAKDSEREVAEALIAAVGWRGSILVYTSFEAKRINALRRRFPELAQPLEAVLARLIDLHPLIRDNVYDPAFGGSFSIKSVLPALVPDLSYEHLEIRNGDVAVTRFARIARGQISRDESSIVLQQLLDYCRLDTFAMVRLHDVLEELAPRAHSRAVGQ